VTNLDRFELEGLVAIGIDDLRASEYRLLDRYKHLRTADADGLGAFLRSLSDLDKRASTLEQILCTLDRAPGPHRSRRSCSRARV